MVMTWVFAIFTMLSAGFAILGRTGSAVTAAALAGADAGIRLAISISGPLALWSGAAKLMEALGISRRLGRLLMPLLRRLFPASARDPELAGALSGNLCANLLGLGNAATPLGIRAVRLLQEPDRPQTATDAMCRLVVMNTASVQLLPTTVATLRSAAGCTRPLDLLPCVWVSSLLSVSAGLAAAWFLGRMWADG